MNLHRRTTIMLALLALAGCNRTEHNLRRSAARASHAVVPRTLVGVESQSPTSSASHVRQALERYEYGDPQLLQSTQPQLADALFKSRVRLCKEGKVAKADSAFSQTRTHGASYKTKAEQDLNRHSGPSRLEKSCGRGQHLVQNQEYDEALKEYTKAIRSDQECAEAFHGRGIAFLKNGFPDAAIEDFRKAVYLKPDYSQAYCERCRAYTMMGITLFAIEDGTRAIRLDPVCAQAYANRGLAYLASRKYDRAIADLNKAIQLDQGMESRLRFKQAQAFYERGTAHLKKGCYEKTIADVAEAIRLAPELASQLQVVMALAYCGIGLADLEKRNYDMAVSQTTEAIRLAPELAPRLRANLAHIYEQWGHAKRRAGRNVEAKADFARAKELRSTPEELENSISMIAD